jgi:hypothetical protein
MLIFSYFIFIFDILRTCFHLLAENIRYNDRVSRLFYLVLFLVLYALENLLMFLVYFFVVDSSAVD